MNCIESFRQYVFYGFRDKLDRKRPKSANFQNFKGFTFSSNLNVVFAKCSYNLCQLLTKLVLYKGISDTTRLFKTHIDGNF
jgi:hypothetical protein